ncbi:hypothetical protein GQ53DRAFT_743707 [Thozetella sp. PMI_491]|nr:hypothetical protein GQ53DRAFT_743707 [Thozetella sp. PMI_491]
MDPTGPASKTAGPHRSNLLNKLDPTVDSRAGNMANVPGGPVASGANSGYPV